MLHALFVVLAFKSGCCPYECAFAFAVKQRHKIGPIFGTATKKERIDESPGPGNYEPHYNKVLTRAPEALILGPKDRQSYIRAGDEPGPGHYEDEKVVQMAMSARVGARGNGFS